MGITQHRGIEPPSGNRCAAPRNDRCWMQTHVHNDRTTSGLSVLRAGDDQLRYAFTAPQVDASTQRDRKRSPHFRRSRGSRGQTVSGPNGIGKKTVASRVAKEPTRARTIGHDGFERLWMTSYWAAGLARRCSAQNRRFRPIVAVPSRLAVTRMWTFAQACRSPLKSQQRMESSRSASVPDLPVTDIDSLDHGRGQGESSLPPIRWRPSSPEE